MFKYAYLFMIVIVFVFVFVLFSPCYGSVVPEKKGSLPDHILSGKDVWEPYYRDSLPHRAVSQWYVPFKTSDRRALRTVSVVSTFGSHRNSYIRGHIHTGLDLIPRRRNAQEHIYVYAMAEGVVCSIHLSDPHLTVVVKHRLSDGTFLFSSYKHLHSHNVSVGMQVTGETRIGRLYTKPEALALGGRYDHLHLEIRKAFDDYGIASWATMTSQQLHQRFHDPLTFLKEKL